LTVFRTFRRFVDVLRHLVDSVEKVQLSLNELVHLQQEQGPMRERLEALELSRARFEAEMQGFLLQAEGKFKAANNAEARERKLKASYERETDPLAPEGPEREETHGAPVLVDDAETRETERLQAMRLVVEPNNKTLAQRAKFGVR